METDPVHHLAFPGADATSAYYTVRPSMGRFVEAQCAGFYAERTARFFRVRLKPRTRPESDSASVVSGFSRTASDRIIVAA